jgi:hypothetical protein
MKKNEVSQECTEKILLIDINLTRGLTLVLVAILLLAVALSYLAWGHQEASASYSEMPNSSAGLRLYYLTQSTNDGLEAPNACAGGYHFASLWEILDPSNLKYNTILGYTRDDHGQGPPSMMEGWVRTGWNGQTTNYPGAANCNAWTSNNPGDFGTVANLDYDWDSYRGTVNVWMVNTAPCGDTLGENHVWCVEDRIGSQIFLPLVMKSF